MPNFVKVNNLTLHLAHKVHHLGNDTLMVALTNTAPNAATNSVLADLTQISYTNLSARTLTPVISAQSAGVYKLTVPDLVLTASGGSVATFQYAYIYNDTATSKNLIGYIDIGYAVTMADGQTLTLDFDGTNGVLQLG